MQENAITVIENLHFLKDLRILNLDDNCIIKIEGLSELPLLETLQVKRNRIGTNGLSDVEGLIEAKELSVLDIQENKIDDERFLTDVLARIPKLGVLYNQGNPWIKKMSSYKKEVITALPGLKYLDDRPVFVEDR